MTETADDPATLATPSLRGVVSAYGPVYLKGMAMGTADALPGISGGTIALITGIYERLIQAITAVDLDLLRDLRAVTSAQGRRDYAALLIERDVPFLLALVVGLFTALLTVAHVAQFALGAARAATFAFFFGLIAASAVVLADEVSVDTPGRILVGLVGFALAFGMSGLSGSGALTHSIPIVVASGAIAVTAMVLPGISGATFLLLLGQYDYMTEQLTTLVEEVIGVVGGGNVDGLLSTGTTVVAFVAGAVVGLFTIAHVVEYALERYHEATLTFLVSLMVGTLRVPAVEVYDNVGRWTVTSTAGVITAALLGAIAVVAMDRYTEEIDY